MAGERGRAGSTGPRGALSRWQTLSLFFVVVIAFGTLSVRAEVQNHSIEVSNWQNCVSAITIIAQFNAQQRSLADVERILPSTASPEGKLQAQRRIAAYEAAIIPLPNCGSKP